MICARKEDKNIVLYNYRFIEETDKVEVSNENFYEVMPYDQWLLEYYIVDKWKTI